MVSKCSALDKLIKQSYWSRVYPICPLKHSTAFGLKRRLALLGFQSLWILKQVVLLSIHFYFVPVRTASPALNYGRGSPPCIHSSWWIPLAMLKKQLWRPSMWTGLCKCYDTSRGCAAILPDICGTGSFWLTVQEFLDSVYVLYSNSLYSCSIGHAWAGSTTTLPLLPNAFN